MKTVLLVIAFLAAVAASGPVRAEGVWVGRATIGDIHRQQFADGVQAQRQAVASKAQFNAEIAAARDAFFKTAGEPAARPAAEKKFADLLMAKDYTYLQTMVAEGTGATGRKRNDALNLLTGGHIDGGIAPLARPAFDRWVEAVRTSLGARSPNELLLVTDGDKLVAAVQASAGPYEAYKRLRDQLEIDRFTTGNAVEAAMTSSGSFRLHAQVQAGFKITEDTRQDLVTKNHNIELRNRLVILSKSGQQSVLRCAYGPAGSFGDGSPRYEHHHFWFGQAPADIDALLALNGDGALGRMATRAALDTCPETSALAKSAAGIKERTATSMGARSMYDAGAIGRAMQPTPATADETGQPSAPRAAGDDAARQARAARQTADTAARMQPSIDSLSQRMAQHCRS